MEKKKVTRKVKVRANDKKVNGKHEYEQITTLVTFDFSDASDQFIMESAAQHLAVRLQNGFFRKGKFISDNGTTFVSDRDWNKKAKETEKSPLKLEISVGKVLETGSVKVVEKPDLGNLAEKELVRELIEMNLAEEMIVSALAAKGLSKAEVLAIIKEVQS